MASKKRRRTGEASAAAAIKVAKGPPKTSGERRSEMAQKHIAEELRAELAKEPPTLAIDESGPLTAETMRFLRTEPAARSIAPRGAIFVDPDDEHLKFPRGIE